MQRQQGLGHSIFESHACIKVYSCRAALLRAMYIKIRLVALCNHAYPAFSFCKSAEPTQSRICDDYGSDSVASGLWLTTYTQPFQTIQLERLWVLAHSFGIVQCRGCVYITVVGRQPCLRSALFWCEGRQH